MAENKKIKVVFAINDFVVGGGQKLIVDQFKYFDKEKFEFYLISLSQPSYREELYDQIPKEVKVYKLNFKNFTDLKSWVSLISILKEIKPDVVRSALFFSNLVFRLLKPFFGYKIIIAEHNTHIDKTKLQILADKILSFMTSKIITDSKTIIDFTSRQEKIPRDKFQVIYNGIDLKEVEDAKIKYTKDNLRKELSIGNDKIILNIARLTAQKNHNLMIESFAKFSEKNRNYKLVIVGGGGLYEELAKKVEKIGLKEKIIMTGGRQDIHRFYLISDFFLLTSLIEGFSLVSAMSMAFGLPVVSTKVAGLDEYVKDGYNGFLTEHSADDIAKKMEIIAKLSEQEKEKYKQNCVKTAHKFDIRNNVKEYEELISKVVGQK